MNNPQDQPADVARLEITECKRAEVKPKDLLTDTHRFREALDHVPAYIYMKDTQSRYLYANRLTLELFGCSAEELVGRDDTHFFPPDTVKRLREVDARVFLGDQTAEEIDVADAEGGRRVYWEVKTPIYAETDHKQILGLLGISTDITARKQAEAAARQSHLHIANILASISDAFFSMTDDMTVTYFNPAAERLLGRSAQDVLGRKLMDAFPEARGSIFEERYQQAIREKRSLSFEAHFDVAPYRNWYDVRVYPQEGGISVYFQVTTERKKAEAALRHKNTELAAALAQVKTLTGLLPICAGCKRIRDDQNFWHQVESYISNHTDAKFTHGLCPDCAKKYYPELEEP